MDSSEYQAGQRRLSPAERAREGERLQRERVLEATRTREREAAEARERAAVAAALAARPLGERLVQTRCRPCHGGTDFDAYAYGWLRWWAVLLRMEWLNGARFEAGERRPIVAHLARGRQPDAAQLAGVVAVAGVLTILVPAVVRRMRRRVR
ncbi:MAG TPA: hypothetical protein VNK91_00025 [Burkholderiaceae bacterium]|nr:hypothetical protein [Burkholderiaceae bacterium]